MVLVERAMEDCLHRGTLSSGPIDEGYKVYKGRQSFVLPSTKGTIIQHYISNKKAFSIPFILNSVKNA